MYLYGSIGVHVLVYIIFNGKLIVFLILLQHMRPSMPVDCPKWLVRLMEHCWETDPKKRPDMKDVVAELEEIRESEEQQTMSKNRQGVFAISCFGFAHER